MEIKYGDGKTKYGPGVEIKLSADEIARAVFTYLEAHDVHIIGARTVRINSVGGSVYVDPSGSVVAKGKRFSGRGENA